MIAFDWSRTVVKAEGARTWIEIPFTDASPLHERVAMIPVVAAMAAEASGQSWRGIEVGRRQVRAWAWADGADAVDRDELREHLTKAAGQAEREAGKHAHTARMATEAAQRHLEAAEEQAERLGEDIRGS